MATTTTPTRSARLPALVYVLAVFGVISGAYGAVTSVNTAATFLKPRDDYQKLVDASSEKLKSLVDPAELKYLAREADARYGRRNAALPLAGIGLILSGLMFAGAMRAMRGDRWGLSAWSFACAASIPYQLLSLALTAAMARDLAKAVAELPPMAQVIVGDVQMLASFVFCGVAILYYGVCVIYLRTPTVRRAFSDGAARTPPSA